MRFLPGWVFAATASIIFFRKRLDFIDIVLLHPSSDRVLLEERKNTHKFTGEVACALCRLRPSLPHEKIPCVALEETTLPSMALKSLPSFLDHVFILYPFYDPTLPFPSMALKSLASLS